MNDVIALGELLIDFTPIKSKSDKEAFEINPGGAPANVLACLSKLGRKTAFIGKVGNDHFGKFLYNYLKEKKIDVSSLKFTNDANTTLAFVHLDKKGERSFSFFRKPGADIILSIKDIDYKIIKDSKIFHFGSLSLTDEPARKATFDAVNYAKKEGLIISYDPNYRKPLWKNINDAKKYICLGSKFADIIKVSHEELELITSRRDLNDGTSMLYDMGISIILVTLGEKGAYYKYKGGKGLLKTYKVKVIDTTGAGDAFMGAILYKLSGKSLDEINNLHKNEFEQTVNFANATGALTTTKKGAIPSMPGLKEINNYVKSFKK